MARVGTICYATTQGLGYLAKSFWDAGVIHEVAIFKHPSGRRTHAEWYPPGTLTLDKRPFEGEEFDGFLSKVDVLLFFETPFDWSLLKRCLDRGIKTALVPMYEWFPQSQPGEFDKYLCPSLLDLQYFALKGRQVSEFVPVPVELMWRRRRTAKRFLHNAGGIGSRNHKGTEEFMRAIPLVKGDVEFKITSQTGAIQNIINKYPQESADPRLTVEVGDKARDELFAWGDVYVAPEKYNGLSLPLQEAFADGMPVLTTDRFPTNTWLPRSWKDKPLLFPVRHTQKVRVAPGHVEIDESVVAPEDIAAVIDYWANQDIEGISEQGMKYGLENNWGALKHKWVEALEQTCQKQS